MRNHFVLLILFPFLSSCATDNLTIKGNASPTAKMVDEDIQIVEPSTTIDADEGEVDISNAVEEATGVVVEEEVSSVKTSPKKKVQKKK